MIKFEHTEVVGWGHAVRGCRNPMNSWDKSDTLYISECYCDDDDDLYLANMCGGVAPVIGKNDLDLMKRLRNAGTDHRKFMRMIVVYVDITAPLYWWKEFDTYKVGSVANSCSTMHKIAAKEFTLEDFSHDHLNSFGGLVTLQLTIKELNIWRDIYLNGATIDLEAGWVKEFKPKDKEAWWQMIQLLPSSYNQKRTIMLNYEVLANIYKSRRNHKLDEWAEHETMIKDLNITGASYVKDGIELEGTVKETEKEYFGFCDWIKTLPYSELITGEYE